MPSQKLSLLPLDSRSSLGLLAETRIYLWTAHNSKIWDLQLLKPEAPRDWLPSLKVVEMAPIL